ncbi:DUF4142 domain-containing protein [Salinarimonas rosea]|uniref:DUF4142 domain-containing protein n=1 Tax=Salinarimonas rosea TaxID=552063 RepID=UPI000405796A|nr:DUF4142 domain-containing protein [Salinarimonas rosea]
MGPVSTPLRALALAVSLLALAGAPPLRAQDGVDAGDARAPEAAPFTPEEAAERIAPQTQLDWRTLEDLDAPTYLGRLVALDRLAMRASELVLARDPRPRTTDVARDILEAHEAGRAIAQETLPESVDAGPVALPGDGEAMAALAAATRPIDFEELYIDAMIEAHREAVGLTSFYRRFGSDENVRELARRILPMLEVSLYQAVTIRQELVAEFIADG